MLLESFIQKLAKAMGHVCNVHSKLATLPFHPRRALLTGAEVRPFLIRWILCAFSDFTLGRCYITQSGAVNGNAIVVTSSRAT